MKLKLTARTVSKLTSGDKPYEVMDTDLKGFILRVQISGVMTYYFSYRMPDGKRNRYRIGKHTAVTPMQARSLATQLHIKVLSGINIQDQKKQARAEASVAALSQLGNFIEQKYEPWFVSIDPKRKRSMRVLKKYFKEFWEQPLGAINLSKVDDWRSKRLKKGLKPATIN